MQYLPAVSLTVVLLLSVAVPGNAHGQESGGETTDLRPRAEDAAAPLRHQIGQRGVAGGVEQIPPPAPLAEFGSIRTLTARIGLPPRLQETERQLDEEAQEQGDSNKKLTDFAAEEFGRYGDVYYGIGAPYRNAPFAVEPVSGAFCYRPLYFEEANLERYGSNRGCLQPALSAGRFFATIPALPYLMTVEHPDVCYDWYWPYAAGRPAPRVRELPPLDGKAGVVTGGVATGLFFLIP